MINISHVVDSSDLESVSDEYQYALHGFSYPPQSIFVYCLRTLLCLPLYTLLLILVPSCVDELFLLLTLEGLTTLSVN